MYMKMDEVQVCDHTSKYILTRTLVDLVRILGFG
jgi:hypothetical protein